MKILGRTLLTTPATGTAIRRGVRVGGCGCGRTKAAADVYRALGMRTHNDDLTSASWPAHIAEERAKLFPKLAALAIARKDDRLRQAVARLEDDHRVYLALLDKDMPLPSWRGSAHSTLDHAALEDVLVMQYRQPLLDLAAKSVKGGEAAMVDVGAYTRAHPDTHRTMDGVHAESSALASWPWVAAVGAGAATWWWLGPLAGLGALGAGAVAARYATAAPSSSTPSRLPAPPLPLDLGAEFVDATIAARDTEADALYDRVKSRWRAYANALGGKAPPGVGDAVALVDAASEAIRLGIEERVAAGKSRENAFLDGVKIFFGESGAALFRKVMDFAKSLDGADPLNSPDELAAAEACAKAYIGMGGPVPFVSSYEQARLFQNYRQLRHWWCDDNKAPFVAQPPSRQSALRAVARTMFTRAQEPGVANLLRFGLEAQVLDSGSPAAREAWALVPGPYQYGNDVAFGEWAVMVAQLAAIEYGGDAKSILRAVWRVVPRKVFVPNAEFGGNGEVDSVVPGFVAQRHDYGAGEFHTANDVNALVAIKGELARLAQLAAQKKALV